LNIARLVKIDCLAGDWDPHDWLAAGWDPPVDELSSRSELETDRREIRASDRGASRLTAWAACFPEAQREREQAAVVAYRWDPDEAQQPLAVEACCWDPDAARNSKPLSSR
jgi:hypothetical protein